jgi:hypothetical protein
MNLRILLLLLFVLPASSCTEKNQKAETEKAPVANKSTTAKPAFDADGGKSGGAFSITEDSVRLYVSAPTGVSIRTEPNANAPEVTRVPYGEKLAPGKNSNFQRHSEKVIVEGIQAYWMPVTYKGKSGYIPDITVLNCPPPAARDTDLKSWIRHIAKPLGPRFEQKPNWDKMGDMGTGIVRQLYDNGAVYTEGSGYEWGHNMLQLPATNVRSVLYALRNLRDFGEIINKGGALRKGKYEVPGPYAPYKWTVEMDEYWLKSVEVNWEGDGYSNIRILQVESEVLIVSSSGV